MKKIVLLCLLIVSAVAMHGQDAKSLFINMPDTLMPLLTKVNREDFADFLESKMKAQVKNRMDKMSEMKELSKDYLFVQTTSQSSFQMKLLQLNDTAKVICTINTVCGPVCDSSIKFYTTAWKELPSKEYLELPSVEQFFLAPDSAQMEAFNNARASLDIYFLKADLSKEGTNLTFTYTASENMTEGDAEVLKPFLKKELVYTWQNGRFALK